MLIYKKTFENIKTKNLNFPVEDQYYATESTGIIADGITRDPIGISDFLKHSKQEFYEKYPRPSGAELASKEICDTFSKTTGSLKDKLIECNRKIKELNEKYILECDYLINDYFGAVASCINIKDNILDYAYICDCGIIIYDRLGNIKFQTIDDKKEYSDLSIDNSYVIRGISWNLPEARVMVRKEYRNNPNNIVNGKCVSFGALTGELEAEQFINCGEIQIESGDSIVLYSDGFSNYLHDLEFIKKIIDFRKEEFETYINYKERTDYSKYGKEKSIVLYRK